MNSNNPGASLYHMVPKNLSGNRLVPLNQMKESLPKIYEREARKYRGRESLMDYKIPLLDCLWNDVLFLFALNPQEIVDNIRKCGGSQKFNLSCFEIDPRQIDANKTVCYTLDPDSKERNYERFHPDHVGKYNVLPEMTRKYYQEQLSQGKPPLLFHGIPHILYRGELFIQDLRVVTTS